MNTLPKDVLDAVECTAGLAVRTFAPVGGGCIAHAGKLDTPDGPYFLKWGRDAVGETFPAEAAGLRALHAAGSPLRIPEVHAVRGPSEGGVAFLLTSWIEPGRGSASFWETFGEGLAALHGHAADRYGFEQDNFIGRLPQANGWAHTWPAFFREQRLLPQVAMARERGRWQARWDAGLEGLLARLDDLLPACPEASTLHGDLWSGNFLETETGAALIDPAAYYGHREADLAMTELFGGFDGRFYQAYRAAWPIVPGYEERRAIYSLYHVINHLNHFGGSYAGGVASTLERFA